MPKSHLLMTTWKAYETPEAIENYVTQILQQENDRIRYGLALPYPFLKEMSAKYASSNLLFGCTKMNNSLPGSFTESINGKMLKNAGAAFVLIGSADDSSKEGKEALHVKIGEALRVNILPIVCISESAEEYQEKRGEEAVEKYLSEIFQYAGDSFGRLAIYFQMSWIKNLPFHPSSEEITSSMNRYAAILSKVAGDNLPKEVFFFLPEHAEVGALQRNADFFVVPSQVPRLFECLVFQQEKMTEESKAAEEPRSSPDVPSPHAISEEKAGEKGGQEEHEEAGEKDAEASIDADLSSLHDQEEITPSIEPQGVEKEVEQHPKAKEVSDLDKEP